MTHPYQEIRLQDLSASESQGMVESILKTKTIPAELQRFLQDKVEGNPFYIEEVINSLIESDTLIRDNSNWKLTRDITEAEVSSTIHGVISGRLDRLEKESKRILQEASVIGRTFFYEILNRVTELKQQIDQSLRSLERLDLIRARALQPDLEYIFKHALTQEVVYNGLLKKERRAIHERIGLVMEQLFNDRLPEFYETLAYHFQQGQSVLKAVTYLMKAGEKSLKRYAVEEAHRYYQEAFDLLSNKPEKTKDEELLLMDLILDWAMVFYYRADCFAFEKLFVAYEEFATNLEDKQRTGMFFAWLGFIFYGREKYRDSYQYLHKAIKMGEEIQNDRIIGHACAWLCWTCCELGLLDEAITQGQRAQRIAKIFGSDHYLFFKSLGGLSVAYNYKGERKKVLEAGEKLLGYGQKYSDLRSIFLGYQAIGLSHLMAGNFQPAQEFVQKAVNVSVDPIYSSSGRMTSCIVKGFSGHLLEIEEEIEQLETFSREYGYQVWSSPARLFRGVICIAKGQMNEGLKTIKAVQASYQKSERIFWLAQSEAILGRIYLQLVEGAKSVNLSSMAKNIGFLLKNAPSAAKKAEMHFNRAIEIFNQIDAKNYVARTYIDLGALYKAKKRTDQARQCLSKAIDLFEQCEADFFLQQAKEELASLR